MFKRDSKAFEVLSDAEKRSSYDLYGKDSALQGGWTWSSCFIHSLQSRELILHFSIFQIKNLNLISIDCCATNGVRSTRIEIQKRNPKSASSSTFPEPLISPVVTDLRDGEYTAVELLEHVRQIAAKSSTVNSKSHVMKWRSGFQMLAQNPDAAKW